MAYVSVCTHVQARNRTKCFKQHKTAFGTRLLAQKHSKHAHICTRYRDQHTLTHTSGTQSHTQKHTHTHTSGTSSSSSSSSHTHTRTNTHTHTPGKRHQHGNLPISNHSLPGWSNRVYIGTQRLGWRTHHYRLCSDFGGNRWRVGVWRRSSEQCVV